MNDKRISQEILNASIDGQLDSEERTALYRASQDDPSLSADLCELRNIKELVQLAYENPLRAVKERRRREPGVSVLKLSAAAAVLLMVGSLSGWLAHGNWSPPSPGGYEEIARIAPAAQDLKRVVLHIATADPERVTSALDDAEQLLRTYQLAHEDLRMEVVANAEGINLLRANGSPYAERIHRISQAYDNIRFVACQRAIEKMQLKGVDVHLVPEAQVVHGALEEIVSRLKDGWVYIRA